MKNHSSTINKNQIVLVTGGSRSGKSEWAENLAEKTNKNVVYLATATIDITDQEWQARIIKHQKRRPTSWQTITENKDLVTIINQASSNQCLLIDSLGTWVANFLDIERESTWQEITNNFLSSLTNSNADLILVGEETGWGVVPAYIQGRLFRDRLGHLIRQVGTLAHTTYLVAGGHALNLTLLGTPLSK